MPLITATARSAAFVTTADRLGRSGSGPVLVTLTARGAQLTAATYESAAGRDSGPEVRAVAGVPADRREFASTPATAVKAAVTLDGPLFHYYDSTAQELAVAGSGALTQQQAAEVRLVLVSVQLAGTEQPMLRTAVAVNAGDGAVR